MVQSSFFNRFLKLPGMIALSLACGLAASAQTAMVQVPFASSVLGIPSATYNSTIPGTPCTTGLSATGDGCPGTSTTLFYTYSVAVDASGDLAVATAAGTVGITVLYEGGTTMANLLTAAKPNYSFTPTVGNAYFLTNGTANLQLAADGKTYYCNGVSGTAALDKYANGCPSTYADSVARSVTFDPDGNIFFGEYEPYTSVRVIYSGGARAAGLISAYALTAYGKTVTPQVGYIYALSSPSGADFGSIRGLAVQPVNATTENIFISDNGTSAAATGVDASTTGNQIKEFVCPSGTTGCNTAFAAINGNKNTVAGWVTYIPGTTTIGVNGDGGVPSLAAVDDPTCLQVDKFGNLYIGDVNDARIRVVYVGGSTPPLYVFSGSGTTVSPYVTTPTVGDIYTVVGGATPEPASPAKSNTLETSASNFGLDLAGNLYFTKNDTLWVENATTGVAVNTMWSGAGAVTFTANATPGAGAGCNGTAVGSVTGPAMTDAYGDGCPGTEVGEELPNFTPIVFDTAGNFYLTDARQGSIANSVVRKYTFGNQFGAVPVGSSVTMPFAFTPSANGAATTPPTYTPTLSFSSPEYTDAGGDNCTSVTGTYKTQTCVYNVTFKPTRAGSRPGSLTLSQTGNGVLDTIVLGGIGTAAQGALDPASASAVGTGLTPAGVGVDTNGNAYLADTTTNTIYKSTAGGTPASFATGLSNPAQIAIGGPGSVYIADKGNNRIASVTSAGGVATTFLPATFTLTTGTAPSTSSSATLSGPSGVAVDNAGNVYVSDTGNNRVIEVITPQGGGASANVLLGFSGLSSPRGLSVDASGDVFVADSGNHQIVELTPAGVQSAVSISPSLSTPVGVSLDAAGDLYIADSGSQSIVLVSAGSTTPNTLLGSTTGLTGVAVDNTGDIFIASSTAGGLVELNRMSIAVAYPLTNVGSTSSQLLALTNTGNTALTTGASLDSGTDTTNFAIAAATTNGCTANESISPGTACSLAATFQPQAIGKFSDTVTFPASSAVNAPTALLSGTGAKETPTTTTVSYVTNAPVTPSGGLPLAGTAFTVTATIALSANVGAATGNVVFTVDGNVQKPIAIATSGSTTTATISLTLNAGPHNISAAYQGDGNYAGSSGTLAVTVVTPQTSKLALSYTLGTLGATGTNTTITAALSAPVTTAAFSGTVTFVVDGVTQTPAATVSSAGVASITVPLTAGSHTVVATYAGTSYYSTSTNTETFSVVTGTSSIALTVLPTGTVTFGTPVMVSAVTTTGNSSATPGGTITFNINGKAQTPIAFSPSISTALPMLSPGMYTIFVSYSGDQNYAASQSPSTVFNVVKSPSTLALVPTPNIVVGGNTVTLTATIGPLYLPTYPTGTVTFSAGSTNFPVQNLTVNSNVVSYTVPVSQLTTFSFTAAYSGDANYLPSTATNSPGQTFTVASSSATITMPQNSVATDTVSLSSFYGYTGKVSLSCKGLPANTTCVFSPLTTTFTTTNISAVQTVGLQIYTNASPLATASVTRKSGNRGALLASCVCLSLCFSLPAWSRRRRLMSFVLSVLLLTAAIGITGCASDTADSKTYQTPTGTYAVGIVATDGTTTASTPLTVIVIAGPSGARPN